MSKSNGKFYRDASNRLTYDIHEIEADRYPQLCNDLATTFDLKPASELVVGLDEMFWDFTNGLHTIEFGWDIWSGFFITAKDSGSESLVRQIAELLVRDDCQLGGP
ncbi:MAG: hypothetical protein WD045_16780 [Pirellulaceae bacterium]